MKKVILLLFLLSVTYSSYGIHIECGNEVLIEQPVNEDLYVAGGTVVINAPVRGDLIVAGGTVTINDSVANDIILAGGTVNFNGFVGDDVRCAGGTLHVSNDIFGDLVVGGGTVTIDRDVDVANLLVSSGNITMNGNVKGELRAAAGSLRLSGIVDGDIDCRVSELTVDGTIKGNSVMSAEKITLGKQAAFYGDIRYWTRGGAMQFGAHQKQGSATYDTTLAIQDTWMYLGFASLVGVLIYLASALLMIWLIQYLFRNAMRSAGKTMRAHPGTSLGYGFLFLVAIPVVALIAFMTVIGIPVGILLTTGYIILVLFATAITSLVIANGLIDRGNKDRSVGYRAMIAFLLFISLKVISFIPVLGWLAVLLVVCMAFGALIIDIQQKRKALRLQAQPAPSVS